MTVLRHALRSLRRAPGFTAIAVFSLALAIGSATTVFSVVDAVVLHGMPYGDAGDLRSIYERSDDGKLRMPSYPTFLDWRTAITATRGPIEDATFIRGDGMLIGASTERQIGAFVSPGFFDLMRTRPYLGRTFLPEEEAPGAPRVAVLSYDSFIKNFAGDRSIVGKAVPIDSVPTTVVGVMPPGFAAPNFGGSAWVPPAAWQPVSVFQATHPEPLTKRELHVDSRALVRLRPGADSAGAAAAMRTIEARLAAAYPKDQAHWTSVALRSLSDEMFGSLWSTLSLVSGAIGLVLLLACANVANLMLIRGSVRGQELAVRAALGAGRWRIARQPLTEAAVIAVAGGVLGMLLAALLVHVGRPLVAFQIPFSADIALDPRALWFTIGVVAVTTSIIGGIPALRASRANLIDRLRGGAASRAGTGDFRLRDLLVSLQFALAITLLVGAGLLIQSVRRMSAVKLGYDPHGLIAFGIAPTTNRYKEPASAAALYARIIAAVRAVPGIEDAAAAGGALLPTKVEVEGHDPTAAAPVAAYHPISADYFATERVPMKRGRAFTDDDMRSPVGLIVNDTLARQLWPHADPIGQRITIYRQSQGRPDVGQPITLPIVGVVADYHEFGPTTDPQPQVFLPYTLEVWPWMNFVARGPRTATILEQVDKAVTDVDPTLAAFSFGKPSFDTSDELPSFSDPRMFVTALLSGFAMVALLLAAIGLYGVVSYAVMQRLREIGIRIAIGATHRNIVALLLRQASVFVLGGVGAGVLVALATVKLLQSLLFQTTTTDITTFVMVPAVLTVVAFVASCIPAIRAARTDPTLVMKAE